MQTPKDNFRHKALWITRTGVLIALLITLQWATAGTQAFAGQYITGSCVNCVLTVAVLLSGLWSGMVVAILSPFCAFLLGIGPALLQIVPCIALGNVALVLALHFALGTNTYPVWRQAVGLGVAATVKFVTLYVAVVKVFIPLMGTALAQKQIAVFTAMFSWPQLVTALTGGSAALLILPILKKAMNRI